MKDLLAVELGHWFPRPWLHENLDCADQEASRRESARNYFPPLTPPSADTPDAVQSLGTDAAIAQY
jgi:hypothetical protein